MDDIEKARKCEDIVDSMPGFGMEEAIREQAIDDPLIPTRTATDLVCEILSDGPGNFIGKGTYSRVYGNSSEIVIKFSWNLETLHIMQRLAERSDFFPKVFGIYENQAVDSRGDTFHAAVVERLVGARPRWVRDVVDGYRQPWRAESSHSARQRLLTVCYSITDGQIWVPADVAAGLCEALKLLGEECVASDAIPDLRVDLNFLRRANGQVVIADPAHPSKYMNQ